MIQHQDKIDSAILVENATCNSNDEQSFENSELVEASTSANEISYPPDVKMGFDELCPVCGDKVSGYHYGLLTCESCKGFFKRTVQNKKVYSCVDNRSCHIDKSQRKRCPYCRFQKCLNVGMKLEAVRSDRMRGGRNKFGPMYKRDRALKQQAVRQQHHMLASCQMRLANGMTPLPITNEDIKPDPAMLLSANSNMVYHGMNSSPGAVIPSSAIPEPMATDLTVYSRVSEPTPITTSASQHTQGPYVTMAHTQSYPSVMNALRNNYSTPHGQHQQHIQHMPIVPQLIQELKASMLDEHEVRHKMLTYLQNEFGHEDFSNHLQSLLKMICKLSDQMLFLMVEWARQSAFFRELKVEDQMHLLQNCWSEILILDFVHRQVRNTWTGEVLLNNGQKLGLDSLDKMGLSDVKDRIHELVRKMKDLKIDSHEYICLKFLILLNPDTPGLENRDYVEQCQEKVNASLMEYCVNFYPNMKDKFGQVLLRLPEVRLVSIRLEEYLYFKHINGEISEQSLLMEMLHSKRK